MAGRGIPGPKRWIAQGESIQIEVKESQYAALTEAERLQSIYRQRLAMLGGLRTWHSHVRSREARTPGLTTARLSTTAPVRHSAPAGSADQPSKVPRMCRTSTRPSLCCRLRRLNSRQCCCSCNPKFLGKLQGMVQGLHSDSSL